MPLPSPRKNEKKTDFMSRCMGNDTANSDFPDSSQRAAVCNSQWSRAKKSHHDKKPKKKALEAAEQAEKVAEDIKSRHAE